MEVHTDRVLIVDDEPAVRLALQCALEDAGLHVDSAADGHEALQLMAARSYAVVLTDWSMPGLSGLDLRERATGLAYEPRWILMTGNAGDARLKHAPMPILPKPIRIDDLLATFAAVLPGLRLGSGLSARF